MAEPVTGRVAHFVQENDGRKEQLQRTSVCLTNVRHCATTGLTTRVPKVPRATRLEWHRVLADERGTMRTLKLSWIRVFGEQLVLKEAKSYIPTDRRAAIQDA